MRSDRVLLAAFAGVACAFVLATTFAETVDLEVRSAAQTIATDASPSIAHLSIARSEMRRLGLLLARRVGHSAPMQESREDIAESRRAIGAALAQYRALPVFPGEEARWPAVGARWAQAQSSIDSALGAIDEGNRAMARATLEQRVEPRLEQIDSALAQLVALNVDAQRTLGARVIAKGRYSVVIAIALDVVGILLTVVAALLTLKIVRRYRGLLEERADELEQFAGRVAHDVLSPLGATGLAIDVAMRSNPGNHDLQQLLGRGRAALHRAKLIADGLLEFARAGARPDRNATASVAREMAGVIEDLGPFAKQSNIDLRVEPLEDAHIAASPGILTSLLGNLIRNAIKYGSGKDGARVTARAQPRKETIRIEVEDEGPGLPPELGESVFEPYVRAAATGQPGIGLGLATVKRIAEAHGGHVGVRSSPNGCLFWFELPRAKPVPEPARTDPRAATPSAPQAGKPQAPTPAPQP